MTHVRREPGPIRSRSNRWIRSLRLLTRSPEARERERAYVAIGVRIVEEALRWAAPIEGALTSPRLSREPRGKDLEPALRAAASRYGTTTDELLAWIQGVPRHQGVLARVTRPEWPLDPLLDAGPHPLLVVTWGVQDPGNLGGILRIAAATGATGLLTVEGTVDPFNPKAVRASAGAIFHLPVVRGLAGLALLERLAGAGFERIAAVAGGGAPYDGIEWKRPTALLLGGEGAGIPEIALSAVESHATIPMAPGIPSINVLSAATLFLYEAARQRGFPSSRPPRKRAVPGPTN